MDMISEEGDWWNCCPYACFWDMIQVRFLFCDVV